MGEPLLEPEVPAAAGAAPPRRSSSADPLLVGARRAASLLARWHRADLEGAAALPAGPALLVGNHGLFGLETPVFFWLLEQATGRLPCGLADRRLFGNRLVRPLLSRLGGVSATPDNAMRMLGAGHLVVCYPGGALEVFKGPADRYRLRWEHNLGFARLAIRARVPIVPFAGLGVDDSYVNLGHVAVLRALLGRYAAPLAFGLGPLPLPSRLRFVLGRPIEPPDDPRAAPALKRAVECAVAQLMQRRGWNALPAQPATVLP